MRGLHARNNPARAVESDRAMPRNCSPVKRPAQTPPAELTPPRVETKFFRERVGSPTTAVTMQSGKTPAADESPLAHAGEITKTRHGQRDQRRAPEEAGETR